jgi:hypothetical protein
MFKEIEEYLKNFTGLNLSFKWVIILFLQTILGIIILPLWSYIIIGLPMGLFSAYMQKIVYPTDSWFRVIISFVLNTIFWSLSTYLNGLRLLEKK